MKKQTVKEIFERDAEDWIAASYEEGDFTYPVALHRVRIVERLLARVGGTHRVADLGCGGGNLALRLAEAGHEVTGVDQSQKMISIANDARSALDDGVRNNVSFQVGELEDNGLEPGAFDTVTAMGVIGYLEADDALFRAAATLLRPGGTLILSCRNRLFNMNSLTYRTINEIASGDARVLIDEIGECYHPVPDADAEVLLERLEGLSAILEKVRVGGGARWRPASAIEQENLTPFQRPEAEARQHTPKEITETAARFDFKIGDVFGVHPHLIDPNVNRLLPPGVFHALSSCLEAFEHLPVSLVWSSMFIASFEKSA